MPRSTNDDLRLRERASLRLYLRYGRPQRGHDILMDAVHHNERGARYLVEIVLSLRVNRNSRRSMAALRQGFGDGDGPLPRWIDQFGRSVLALFQAMRR